MNILESHNITLMDHLQGRTLDLWSPSRLLNFNIRLASSTTTYNHYLLHATIGIACKSLYGYQQVN